MNLMKYGKNRTTFGYHTYILTHRSLITKYMAIFQDNHKAIDICKLKKSYISLT